MGVNTIAPYLNSTQIAQQAGKPFIMFETNSASCGGFAGISTSFGAALWALDYGLEMAASNFSHALLHVGGQNVYYNVRLVSFLCCIRNADADVCVTASMRPVALHW